MKRKEFLRVSLGSIAFGSIGALSAERLVNYIKKYPDNDIELNFLSREYFNFNINEEMILNKRYYYLENLNSLNMVLDRERTSNLNKEDSEKNIIDNLVTIVRFDDINKHLQKDSKYIKGSISGGGGLLITQDGFIVTNYHIVKNYEDEWRRINQNGDNNKIGNYFVFLNNNPFLIDTSIWITNPSLDIALIKAITFKEPAPTTFKYNLNDLKLKEFVNLLALKDQKLYSQYGRVLFTNVNIPFKGNTVYNTFITDAYGAVGFSGGVFINIEGEFAGLASYVLGYKDELSAYTGGVKVKNILSLVKKSVNELERILV